MAKLNVNKPKALLIFLAFFAALFFGLASLAFVQLVNTNYVFLLAPPLALLIGLLFIFDRYAFFLMVILSRSSLDAAFNAIKIGNFGLGAVLNALVIIIAALTLLEKPVKLDFKLDAIKKAWLIFLTLSFVSIFYAPTLIPSLKAFLVYVSYASVFFLGLFVIKTPEDFGKWMKAVAASSLIPVLYSFYCFAFGGSGLLNYRWEGMRLQSTFPHPNPFAPYLVVIISVTFYLYKSKAEFISSTLRKFLPLYILVLIGLLLMTKTRSAWVVTYLLFFLYAIFHERKMLILVIAAPLFALFIPEIQDRILDLTKGNDFGSTGYERLNSFAWRLKVWGDSIGWMSETRYFLGYGISSFVHFSPEFVMANAFEKIRFDIEAHSIYVQTFFELGLLGLASLCYLLYSYLKTLLSLYERNKLLVFTVTVIFIQYLLQSLTDNLLDYLISEWYMWFVIGITFSYLGQFKDSHNNFSSVSK
ncbi:O-antigen ligase family protein [Methylophilus sp. 'Pure River']|uniref:O-antigen ligase family protein n=1 Tax=Methylophilus sp. 'Pure River' TaxID=3377117 RepID=UPI00398F0027